MGLSDFEPRPAHYAFLRAFREVIDSGAPVTHAAIAKQAGVARESYSRLRSRYPGLNAWLNRQLEADARAGLGAVLEKARQMALRGSPAHMTIYINAVNAGLVSPSGGDGTVVHNNFNGPMVIKMAVPEPGDQPIAADSRLLPE